VVPWFVRWVSRGIALAAVLGAVPACTSDGCKLEAVTITWPAQPMSQSVSVEVDVGGVHLTTSCPHASATYGMDSSGGSYACDDHSLELLSTTLDLNATKTATVTLTTDAGQVLAKDVVVTLGPLVIENSDMEPGYCSRDGTLVVM
jgi:hypothetical protein